MPVSATKNTNPAPRILSAAFLILAGLYVLLWAIETPNANALAATGSLAATIAGAALIFGGIARLTRRTR